MATYAEKFMGKAGAVTGSEAYGYLTLKMPVALNDADTGKAWDTSNCVAFTWNRFTEHQTGKNWCDSYETIKKLLPGLKTEHPWLRAASSQVLQEVAKSHSIATKSCKTKRKKQGRTADEPSREANANFPGFKSRKYFHSHKYPQQGVSFEFRGKTLRLAYGRVPSDWIEASLPHEITEASVKCVTLTHDDRNGFSVCLETRFELPRAEGNRHTLVVEPGCRTALTCLRSDGTVWEYDISPLQHLNLKIYQSIDRLMSRREALPCAVKLAGYRKELKHASRSVGPLLPGYLPPGKPALSREYRRLSAKMAKLIAALGNRSKQYLHTMANKILKDHPMVSTILIGNWEARAGVGQQVNVEHAAISRIVQNSNHLGRLIKYLKYKAAFQAKQVEEFDERGTAETCPERNDVVEPSAQRPCPVVYGKHRVIAPRGINATRKQMETDAYGMWHALETRKVFSSVRTSLAALSCVNLKRSRARVSLTTGTHGVR